MIDFLPSFFGSMHITTVIFIINLILAFVIVFLERKEPSASLAWIMVMFVLPVIGIVFYLLFSQNIARRKIFKLSQSEEAAITNSLQHQIRDMSDGSFEYSTTSGQEWKELIRMNSTYGFSYLTQDNDVEIITDGTRMFSRLLKDIENATTSINAMYFIIKNDIVGIRFIKALTRKAEEGVAVRLLMDAQGSKSITKDVLREFEKAGGKVAYFFPPKFKKINIRFNYRNHRKIVVIDNSIGYIGGYNIAKEYLGLKRKFGYWRDTQLIIQGSSAQDMNARFLLDWRFASGEDVSLTSVFYDNPAAKGKCGVQIVSSGPDSTRVAVKRAYMRMITSAQESIYLQTPYFVPDASILESLKMAAQSGVDVRIMIPCKPDHIFVYWGTYSYVGELINSGARAYIYDNGFLHAKTIVADGEVASVGSANFDRRSFALNFEANAFVYDRNVARKLQQEFENDMKQSHELTKKLYSERSAWIKVKEACARLMSDIL